MFDLRTKIKQFWDSVEKLRRASGLKHEDIAELLMMTDRRYWARYESNKLPHIMGILSFTKHFDLDPRKFVRSEIDWPSVMKRLRTGSAILPER